MTSITARIAAVLAALAAALFLSSCNSPAPDGHTDHEHTEEIFGGRGSRPASTPTTWRSRPT